MKPSLLTPTQLLPTLALALTLGFTPLTWAQKKPTPSRTQGRAQAQDDLEAISPETAAEMSEEEERLWGIVSSQGPRPPSQKDILKDTVAESLFSLPTEAADFTLSKFSADDFSLLVNEHQKFKEGKKQQSPFNVFAANFPKMKAPNFDTTWNLANHSDEFATLVEQDLGLCAGLTFVLRRMHLLAYYKPSASLGIPRRQRPDEWIEEMKKRIDRIVIEKKPTVIPEFKNLSDLSSTAELNLYLRKLVIREWAVRAASIGGLRQLYQTRKAYLTTQDATRIYNDIAFRLQDLKYPPVISATRNYQSGWWIHVLNVVGLSGDLKKGFEITFWEVGESLPENVLKTITVTKVNAPNGNGRWEATYADVLPLNDIMIHPHDDAEVTEMVKNSLDFCAKNRPLCTQVK